LVERFDQLCVLGDRAVALPVPTDQVRATGIVGGDVLAGSGGASGAREKIENEEKKGGETIQSKNIWLVQRQTDHE
jgi:hypothetical protein